MIFVDRAFEPTPKELIEKGLPALDGLRKLFSASNAASAQATIPFNRDIYASNAVKTALRRLFFDKCAFCESPLTKGDGEVLHWRPTSRAAQLKGEVAPHHYWWLAYEWNNLYLSCIGCFKSKGSRFPVQGERVSAETRGEALARENVLLVDPCHPGAADHFTLLGNGEIEHRTPQGATTIQVFSLNRPDLVTARRQHAQQIKRRLYLALKPKARGGWTAANLAQRLAARFRNRTAYFGLTLQQAARSVQLSAHLPDPTLRKLAGVASAPWRTARSPSANWLRRIEIENFRALDHIELELPQVSQDWWQTNLDSEDQEPWLVFLGNNGVGKSSILKAIAIALATPAQRRQLVPDARKFLTQGRGQTKGRIRLWFTQFEKPTELTFGRSSREFKVAGPHEAHVPVLGYGSTRLLPPPSAPQAKSLLGGSSMVRIGNLFSAAHALSPAERWLADSRSVKRRDFDLMCSDLKTLLALDNSEYLSRSRRNLIAHLFRKELPVRELSDGFQSVLALALDMMQAFSQTTHDMHGVEGLVLLDEIEVHLHPTWKAHIVRDLRKMFPRTRFIVTTHDPLCVQGLAPGELHVLTRNAQSRRVESRQIDVPLGFRADQILTGEWFGLGSTRDPDTLRLMERHSRLLLIENPSKADEAERHRIELQLRERIGRFADSPYERVALRAYAEFAQRRADVPLPEQHQALRQRIRELLPREMAP